MRYKDADKIESTFDEICDKCGMAGALCAGCKFEQARIIVENTPTEEVAPIIHGEWKQVGDYDENDNGLFECSNCRRTDTHSKAVKVPYCWFCGAKMKGASK